MPDAVSPLTYVRDVDLATRYRVSRNTIWRWTKEGRLPAPVRLGPGCTRWSMADIEAHEGAIERGAA